MKTIGSVLKRLLLALGGSAAENYLNDITLVDRIAELAENGDINSSVIKGGGGEDIVPISRGGTGADNAADARENLGLWSVDYAQAQDISALTSLNGTFSAPDNGFIFGELVKDDDSADSQYELKIGNKIVVRYRVWPSNVFYSSFCIPIAKGETITVSRCTNMYFPESLYLPKFIAI